MASTAPSSSSAQSQAMTPVLAKGPSALTPSLNQPQQQQGASTFSQRIAAYVEHDRTVSDQKLAVEQTRNDEAAILIAQMKEELAQKELARQALEKRLQEEAAASAQMKLELAQQELARQALEKRLQEEAAVAAQMKQELAQQDLAREVLERKRQAAIAVAINDVAPVAISAKKKMKCRFGARCNAPSCAFLHPGDVPAEKEPVSVHMFSS